MLYQIVLAAARIAQHMVLKRGHTLAEEENDRDCHLRKKFPLSE
jgi:hypothetical protein